MKRGAFSNLYSAKICEPLRNTVEPTDVFELLSQSHSVVGVAVSAYESVSAKKIINMYNSKMTHATTDGVIRSHVPQRRVNYYYASPICDVTDGGGAGLRAATLSGKMNVKTGPRLADILIFSVRLVFSMFSFFS